MKTTISDTAIRNYLVVIRISDKEWMAFIQDSHYNLDRVEVGRFYWYRKYPSTMSQAEVKVEAINDLFSDLEKLGT